MYNKKPLREAINNLDRTKAPAKKKDIIVDPMGQWKYPGQNTRIPGNDITMQGVPYPVWAVPNVGTPQMMYPEQDYYFPGADHVDEYPQVAQRGGDISIPQLNQYEDGGEYDLTQKEIDDLIAQGYNIEDVTDEYQVGGPYNTSGPISEPASEQDEIQEYTPALKPKAYGHEPEDYSQFQNFAQTLPSNLQDPGYQYGNPDQYDLYGMWRTVGKPGSFKDVQDTDYFTLQPDNTYHGFSVGDDGTLLKPMGHHTTWMEVMNSQLNTDPYFRENRLIKNEQGRLQYVPNRQDGGVSPLEGNYISNVIMNRNRGTDFVDRAYALGANPGTPLFNVPDDEQFGAHMSHKMATGEDDSGQTWMFPTVLNPNNEAIKVPNQYADYISSEGYKYATGMKQYGGLHKFLPKAQEGPVGYAAAPRPSGFIPPKTAAKVQKEELAKGKGPTREAAQKVTQAAKERADYDKQAAKQRAEREAQLQNEKMERQVAASGYGPSEAAQPVDWVWTLPIGASRAGVNAAYGLGESAARALGTNISIPALGYVGPTYGSALNAGFIGYGLSKLPETGRSWYDAYQSGTGDYRDAIGKTALNALDFLGVGEALSGLKSVSPLTKFTQAAELPAAENIVRTAEQTQPTWTAQDMPGLHLKSTMSNGPISKIVEPKTGLINVEQALGIIGKEAAGADKVALIKKGLGETIPKKMNFNDFRKVVQDQLVPLERQFATHRSDYGLKRINYSTGDRKTILEDIDYLTERNKLFSEEISQYTNYVNNPQQYRIDNPGSLLHYSDKELTELLQSKLDNSFRKFYDTSHEIQRQQDYFNNLPLENETLILSNKDKLGIGSSVHNNPEETLGHIHFLRNAETPDVLTVTQIQSDAFQGSHRIMPNRAGASSGIAKAKLEVEKAKSQLTPEKKAEMLNTYGEDATNFTMSKLEQDLLNAETKLKAAEDLALGPNPIQKKLIDENHQERYLQELVNYSAERGDISKIHLPTSETAAKVQGYKKHTLDELRESLAKAKPEEIAEVEKKYPKFIQDIKEGNFTEAYDPGSITILKKYSDLPKNIKKLFGVEPKVVTDSKGNTWYEFDIPESFKQGKGEIQAFKKGGIHKSLPKAQKGYVAKPVKGTMQTSTSKDGTITNKFVNTEGNTVVQVKTPNGKYYEKILPKQQTQNFTENLFKDIASNKYGKPINPEKYTYVDPISTQKIEFDSKQDFIDKTKNKLLTGKTVINKGDEIVPALGTVLEFTGVPGGIRTLNRLKEDPLKLGKDISTTFAELNTLPQNLMYQGAKYLFGDGQFNFPMNTESLGVTLDATALIPFIPKGARAIEESSIAAKNILKGLGQDIVKGYSKLKPGLSTLKQNSALLNKKLVETAGKLPDNLVNRRLQEFTTVSRKTGKPQIGSVKELEKTLKTDLYRVNKLKKQHPELDFNDPNIDGYLFTTKEGIEKLPNIIKGVAQTKKSGQSYANYLLKDYNTKMNFVKNSGNKVLMNVVDESPQYLDDVYAHLKNPKGSDADFLNDLTVQSNTYTRFMKGDHSANPDRYKMITGKNIDNPGYSMDVEGVYPSDAYGEYAYRVQPSIDRLREIINAPLEQKWSKRIPIFQSDIQMIPGMHLGYPKQVNDFINLRNQRLNRLISGTQTRNPNFDISIAAYPQSTLIENLPQSFKESKYFRIPQHQVFNTSGRPIALENFDVYPLGKLNIPENYTGYKDLEDYNRFFEGTGKGFKNGGFQDDINRRRKLLRDWTYGASIGTLHKAQLGFNQSVLDRFMPNDAKEETPIFYLPQEPTNLKEVKVTAQAPEWARYQKEYQKTKPWEDYLYDEQKKYLRRTKGLNKAAGVSMDNFPQAERIRIKQKYDQKMNNYITKRLGHLYDFNPNRRGDWLDVLSPKEREIVAGSKYGSKLQPSAWSNFLSGARSIYNAIPDYYKPTKDITAPIPGLTTLENYERLNDYLEGFNIFSPLDVPGMVVANKMKNMNIENPSWYSGETMANVNPWEVMVANPLTYILDAPYLAKGLVNLGRGVAKGVRATGRAVSKAKAAIPQATKNVSLNAPLKSGLGDVNMGMYTIKNPDYYTQLLKTYDNRALPAANRKFYKDLIATVKKQNGLVTERQLNELKRLGTGNFDFGSKGYNKGYQKGGNLSKAQDGLAIMNYLINKGLTKEQAAGIAGNIQQESGFNPKARSKSGYIGIAQWDPNSRWPAVQKYIKSQGYDPMSLEGQLEGLYWEANKRGDWKKIAAAQTPEQASAAWLKHFEISGEKPGMAGYNRRVKYANELASLYEPPMEKQIAFQIPPVAEFEREEMPIPLAEINRLPIKPVQQIIQEEPVNRDLVLNQRPSYTFEDGGELDYEDVDLTPEEIDWYLANGYDLEDLGDSESFDDYLPEAQEGLVFKGKTNVIPQAEPVPVKKVEPVKKPVVPVQRELSPYEKIMMENINRRPTFPDKKQIVAQKKDETKPLKKLPNKNKPEEYVFPAMNLGSGAPPSLTKMPSNQPIAGGMGSYFDATKNNIVVKRGEVIEREDKKVKEDKPLKKLPNKITPQYTLSDERISGQTSSVKGSEEELNIKPLNPKIKQYQTVVSNLDKSLQKVYYDMTNSSLDASKKSAARKRYNELVSKRNDYITAINNVKEDEAGWLDAAINEMPTIGKPFQKLGWADNPSYINYDLPKFESYEDKQKKEQEQFKQSKRFEELNPGKSEFTRWKFRAAASNDDPLKVAVYGTRGERANETVDIDSPGAIMHFLDQSPKSGFVSKETKNFYEGLKDTDYVGYLKPNQDGTASLQYKPRKEFNKDNLYKNTFLVRQVKFDNIDFNNRVDDDNFSGHTYPTLKGTKQVALPISSDPDENVYDYSSGQSVVFIFKYKGKIRYQHFAGSRNEIKKEGQDIKKMYNLKDGALTIGLADAGSYSSAVSGKITNDKLNSKDYGYYNPNQSTGAGMAIIP